MAVTQWGFSKSFDDTTPLGPCIVSARAIPNPQALALKTTLNGRVLQDGNTGFVNLKFTTSARAHLIPLSL